MKALTAVLFFLVCALSAVIVIQRSELTQLKASEKTAISELEVVQAELDQRDKRGQSQARQLQDAREQLTVANRTIDRLDDRIETVRESSTRLPQVKNETDAESPQQAMMKALSEMMEQPEMKEMMAEQQRTQVEMMYAAFFENAGLDKTTEARLRELLVERQQAQAELGMGIMADGGEVNREKMIEQVQAEHERYEALIKEELGDDYEALQTYEQSLPDRMTIEQLQMHLGDERLDREEQEALLAIMAEEREAASVGSMHDPKAIAEFANADGLARHVEQRKVMDARVAERSAEFLSEKQLQVLQNHQKMEASMLRMSVMMQQATEPDADE